MTLAMARQLGRQVDHRQGLGASTRFGIDLGNPPSGVNPELVAAMDAVDRATQSADYQLWLNSVPEFVDQLQNLSNLAFRYRDEGQPAAFKAELVSRTAWVNNFLQQHASTTTTPPPTTTTPPPTTTTPPSSTTTPPPASTPGVLDGLKAALANIPAPVKIGGVVVLGYLFFGGNKRR